MVQYDNYPVVKRQMVHVTQTSSAAVEVIPSVKRWLGIRTDEELGEYVLLLDIMSEAAIITHDVDLYVLWGAEKIGYQLSDIGLNHRVPTVSMPLHPLLGGQLMIDDVTWSTGAIEFFVAISAIHIPQSIPAAP